MMLRGLWKLTWVEIKIFLREPLGALGALGMPVLIFLVMGRVFSRSTATPTPALTNFVSVGVPVMAAVLIAIGAVLSLVAIISIYREGGILKRLRATPLRPYTILAAHVIVKLLLSLATLVLMLAAGKRYYPVGIHVSVIQFSVGLLISTWSILSLGFVIASLVPTARFAQPIGLIILYPMLAVSGLFYPIAMMPGPWQVIARALPLSYMVSLLEGIWQGDALWAHGRDIAALTAIFVVCTVLSTKVFRWE